MEQKKIINIFYIILIGLVCIIIYKLYTKQEKFDTLQSNETAVKNIINLFANPTETITFKNLQITNSTVDGNINFAYFKGIIVAWSGETANIPNGWGLCNGTTYQALDGTQIKSPDLRSKFIIGASKPDVSLSEVPGVSDRPNYPGLWLTPQQVNAQGGEETHVLTNNEIPTHHHTYWVNNPPGLYPPAWQATETWPPGGGNSIHTDGTSWQTNQGDPSSTSQIGLGNAHNNMPPYYALAYIIKL